MKVNLVAIKSTEDFEYIRILRNKSYVRLNSLNKKIISNEEHINWVKKNKKNKIYVLKNRKKNVGYIRINKNKFVSWALEKRFWGKIKFSEYLKKSISDKKFNYLCVIFSDNLRSQIVALKAGFRFKKVVGKKIYFFKK